MFQPTHVQTIGGLYAWVSSQYLLAFNLIFCLLPLFRFTFQLGMFAVFYSKVFTWMSGQ